MVGVHSDAPAASLGGPTAWALSSIALWITWVVLKGWDKLSAWERREVAFGLFTALLLLNFLSLDDQFRGWADVYYFCGRQLQYCTCSFRWNARGWAKAYILWSFVLSSASGLQRVFLQIGLNGLLPGEEVVTRESIVSICWRLIPYWLNNWEQSWGAECSSMMFELPHFAVELLVILPCIQILCARLKILAMPLIHVGDATAEPREPLPAAVAVAAVAGQAQPVVLLPGAAAEAVQPPAAPPVVAAVGRRGGRRNGQGVIRDDFAPNILLGFWERRPEQRRLLPRLRANLQVMIFTVCVTALAASNALFVPLMLEASITTHPTTRAIQLAGIHPEWLTPQGFNDVRMAADMVSPADIATLRDRFTAFQSPRQPLLSSGQQIWQLQPLGNGTVGASTLSARRGTSVMVGALSSSLPNHRVGQLIQAIGRQLTVAPLRAAIADRSLVGFVHALLGTELWGALFGLTNASGPPAHGAVASAARRAMRATANLTDNGSSTPGLSGSSSLLSSGAATAAAAAAPPVSDLVMHNMSADPTPGGGGDDGQRTWCMEHLPKFQSNLVKHAEEIHKMQATEHRSLIPLVESALAVMRLSCEKYFVLLSVFVAHLLFREHPPNFIRTIIRVNARLSTAFQKVILYSFPAVCWVYGAGVLFSLFVSAVFWGAPLMSAYESLRNAISTVRIRSLRRATATELERMGGNCTICWGDMHVHDSVGSSRVPRRQEGRTRSADGGGHAASAAAADSDGSNASSGALPLAHATTGPTSDVEPPAHSSSSSSNSRGGGAAELGACGASAAGAGKGDGSAEEEGGRNGDGEKGLLGSPSPAGGGVLPTMQRADSAEGSDDAAGAQQSFGEDARAWSLPCGHAYHHSCLSQWLIQCHSTGMTPACPMCQAPIRLEVQWRFPSPWRTANPALAPAFAVPPPQPVAADRAAAAPARGVVAAGADGVGAHHAAAEGARGLRGRVGGVESDDDEEEEEIDHDADEGGLELVAMPMLNGVGMGRQRGAAAGRVRAARPHVRPHENLLLPPPMAALGGMNMLRLLDHQRELQELLQDMPQIPLPDDVAALQVVAQGHAHHAPPGGGGGGAAVADLPPLPALAAAVARPDDDGPPPQPLQAPILQAPVALPAAPSSGNIHEDLSHVTAEAAANLEGVHCLTAVTSLDTDNSVDTDVASKSGLLGMSERRCVGPLDQTAGAESSAGTGPDEPAVVVSNHVLPVSRTQSKQPRARRSHDERATAPVLLAGVSPPASNAESDVHRSSSLQRVAVMMATESSAASSQQQQQRSSSSDAVRSPARACSIDTATAMMPEALAQRPMLLHSIDSQSPLPKKRLHHVNSSSESVGRVSVVRDDEERLVKDVSFSGAAEVGVNQRPAAVVNGDSSDCKTNVSSRLHSSASPVLHAHLQHTPVGTNEITTKNDVVPAAVVAKGIGASTTATATAAGVGSSFAASVRRGERLCAAGGCVPHHHPSHPSCMAGASGATAAGRTCVADLLRPIMVGCAGGGGGHPRHGTPDCDDGHLNLPPPDSFTAGPGRAAAAAARGQPPTGSIRHSLDTVTAAASSSSSFQGSASGKPPLAPSASSSAAAAGGGGSGGGSGGESFLPSVLHTASGSDLSSAGASASNRADPTNSAQRCRGRRHRSASQGSDLASASCGLNANSSTVGGAASVGSNAAVSATAGLESGVTSTTLLEELATTFRPPKPRRRFLFFRGKQPQM